jgi:hypothetical protein
MAGSLSMVTTAVSLAKVAVVDPGEVGRSALTDDSSVYSVSAFTRKCLLRK